MMNITLKAINEYNMFVSDINGIVFGNFILQYVKGSGDEWVFYPLKNVYIKVNTLIDITNELKLLNKQYGEIKK